MSGLYDEFSCFIEKDLPCLGQGDAPLIPQKKGNAKVLLQLADLTAQRRLRDVQLSRRLTEVEVFRDRNEVSNVT
jgi:hypothetical protein